jgi:predicted metal-dependent hydrolase
MHQIDIGNIPISIVRKDIKNLHLAVYPPKGRVRLAAPLHISDETIRLFAISKLPWIKRQQRKFLAQERETAREYIARESHYYLGKRYLLTVVEKEAPAQIEVKKTTIVLQVRKNSSTFQRQIVMNEWYRRELKKMIPAILAKWVKIVGIPTPEWGVKLMKTKWGTCNSDAHRIWINLELAKKPVICLEYVIVHELVHTLERHHNDVFAKYMDSFMPQWKSYRNELNRLPVSHALWSY